ncbi:hypothetical protein [Bradyrhizobium sp. NP1]|uniref:hypothetical protein n=1 Tax=Bradyrhizobium sp. NP1 TaxID=3049772 RepID=UPI0025A68F86|nr:hypothetical protein [Bradyrhizobium sp. NP1]WJR78655.1 hypothetical protein QOU61_02235 [Bradyrhizobium sp. NP1]
MHALRQNLSTAPDIKAAPLQAYRHRPVRFIELWRPVDDWSLKVYGINADQARNTGATILDAQLLAAAKSVIAGTLRRQEFASESIHKAGYVILHQGVLGNWLLLDWWSHHILWNQLLFRSETVKAPTFTPVTNGITGCVWEIGLMAFERDAWVRLVLQAGEAVSRGEALKAYFATTFNGDI